MGIEDKLLVSKQYPFDDCKLCDKARTCTESGNWKMCELFQQKYSSQQEYDQKEDDSMWRK